MNDNQNTHHAAETPDLETLRQNFQKDFETLRTEARTSSDTLWKAAASALSSTIDYLQALADDRRRWVVDTATKSTEWFRSGASKEEPAAPSSEA